MRHMQDNEVEVKNDIEGGEDTRVYEVGYLLVPTISEENVPGMYGNLKDLVSSYGGMIISDEMPRMIPLAYQMTKVVANVRSKFTNAYFGWIKFSMTGEKVLELKKKLDLSPDIIRFLILKTVKENTIAAKRFIGRDTPNRKVPSMHTPMPEGEAVPINKEEIDKEIDAMVAVQ
jgi:ribosomal protein S6